MTIEDYLSIPVNKDGVEVLPNTLTIDEQLDYLISTNFKLLASPHSKLWRVEHIYSIINKKKEKVKFTLNRAQRKFVTDIMMRGYLRIIILKSRQLGFTTFISIWFLDEIIFNPNTEAMQIAHTVIDAKEIFNKKVKYAISNLSPAINRILKTNTKRAARVEFSYPNNSTSAISTASSARSGTYNLLHLSELAKMSKIYPERADEVITGTLPAVPINGTVIIESTGEGMTGTFHDMFMQSWKRRLLITPQMSKGEFFPVFYNWTYDDEQIAEACKEGAIPTSQMEECEIDWGQYQSDNELSAEEMTFYYLKYIQMNRDVDKLHQEYPTTPLEAFIGTGSNYFSLKRIHAFSEQVDDSQWQRYDFRVSENGVELFKAPKGDIWIADEPKQGHSYVIGGDIAQGLENGDYTALSVVGLDKKIKAMFKGHIEPDQASLLARFLGRKYNNALLAIEANMDGNWVNTDIVNNGYPNIYQRTSFDDITKTMTAHFGWATNAGTRMNMLDNQKVWFNSLDELNCSLLLEEMNTFVRNKRGKPMAMGDNHDDLIISTAIALVVIGTRKDIQQSNKPKSLMQHIFAEM
jgi:hypothetical protein